MYGQADSIISSGVSFDKYSHLNFAQVVLMLMNLLIVFFSKVTRIETFAFVPPRIYQYVNKHNKVFFTKNCL